MRRPLSLQIGLLAALVLCLFARQSFAQMVVNYGFTLNATIPDGTGDFADMRTLGGFASYSNVAVNLVMSSPNGGNPMQLGDLYSSLTIGLPSESERTAVLLNRPGRNNSDPYGSTLTSLNVTLDDSASHSNIWGTSTGTGTYNSDGRAGVNPYGSGVAFSDGDRTNTLAALNGSALTSNRFTLLVADTEASGIARIDSYGLAVSGTAATSGTMSAAGGTMSISDTGSGATNNIGATIDTTQAGGGDLVVNVAGTMTFSNAVSGTSGLTKSGTGSLTLSNAAGNTYGGSTSVNGGRLLVTNTSGSATGTGAVTVSNSGTVLGGTGIITGPVTVNDSAILLGGNGTTGTTLTLGGALTLNDNSIIQLALGAPGAHSTLARSGSSTWSFDSNQAFNFIDLGAASGTYDNIITGLASDPGTEGSWIIQNSGWTGIFTYDGSGNIDLTLTVVPEPGTWAAGILAVLAIGWTQRKRLKKSPK